MVGGFVRRDHLLTASDQVFNPHGAWEPQRIACPWGAHMPGERSGSGAS